MKSILTLLALTAGLSLVQAQEKLSREDALYVAQAVSADAKSVKTGPIPTDVDLEQPVVVRDGDYGGMVLPQKGLRIETLVEAGKTSVPIGQLWLRGLTPVDSGAVAPAEKLRILNVKLDGEEMKAAQCTLALRRNNDSKLELVVLGKNAEPLATSALRRFEHAQSEPLDLDGERNEENGKVKIRILGKYEASITVTELQP